MDPLPNVAIDAMFAKTPYIALERACGLADLYKNIDLLEKFDSRLFGYNQMGHKMRCTTNNNRTTIKLQN